MNYIQGYELRLEIHNGISVSARGGMMMFCVTSCWSVTDLLFPMSWSYALINFALSKK
jgi:hypothetical protein